MDSYKYDWIRDSNPVKELNQQEISNISKQLRHLGYYHDFNHENAALIKGILSDFELSMTRLKDLSEENANLKSKNSLLDIENKEQRQNIVTLRQNNNKLRSEILQESRNSEIVTQKNAEKIRVYENNENRLKLANSQLKISLKQALNDIEDERRSLDEKHKNFLKNLDISSNSTEILRQGWVDDSSELGHLYAECINQLNNNEYNFSNVELRILEAAQQRIKSLEEQVEVLESSSEQLRDEVDISKNHINSRDIEIQRLQRQINILDSDMLINSENGGLGACDGKSNKNLSDNNTEKRLEDQLEYIQTYAGRLEKEKQHLLNKFASEKVDLKNKLSGYKNNIGAFPINANKNNNSKAIPKNESKRKTSNAPDLYDYQSPQADTLDAVDSQNTEKNNDKNKVRYLSFVEDLSSHLQKLENTLLQHVKFKADLVNLNTSDILKSVKNLKSALNMAQEYSRVDEISASEYNLQMRVNATDHEMESIKADRDNAYSLYKQVSDELNYERNSKEMMIESAVSKLKSELAEAEKKIAVLKEELKKKTPTNLKSGINLLPTGEPKRQLDVIKKKENSKYKNKDRLSLEGDSYDERVSYFSDSVARTNRNILERDSLSRDVEMLKRDNNDLKLQLGYIRHKDKQSQEVDLDIENSFGGIYSKHQGSELRKRYKSLLNEYHSLMEAHENLDKSLKKAISDVEKWHARVSTRDNEILKLRKKNNEYILTCRQHMAELRSLRKQCTDLISELKDSKVAQSKNSVDVNKVIKELDNMKTLNLALEMSKKEYKSLYSKYKEEGEDSKMLIRQLTLEKEALNSQLKSLIHRFQRIEQEIKTNRYSSPDVSGYLGSHTDSFLSDLPLYKNDKSGYGTSSNSGSQESAISRNPASLFRKND